jgi:hypothetical protein
MSETGHLDGEAPIDQHRRLIGVDYVVPGAQREVREFAYYGHRILELAADGPDMALHARLQEREIPVFPVTTIDQGRAYLKVPNEARTIQQSLRFIARDIAGYKPIFGMVGDVLGHCEMHGFGLPAAVHTRGILRSIAFTIHDEDDDFGGGVRLFPPYNFSHDATKSDTLSRIKQELLAAGHMNGPSVDELVQATSEEWSNVRK